MLNTEYCEDYLADVRRFADEVGARDALEAALQKLDRGFEHERVFLARDFAPNSFVWTARDGEGRMLMHGGLLYSGPGLPMNGDWPTYSVSLDPDAQAGRTHQWTCHT